VEIIEEQFTIFTTYFVIMIGEYLLLYIPSVTLADNTAGIASVSKNTLSSHAGRIIIVVVLVRL
jgi:hypothetical protein